MRERQRSKPSPYKRQYANLKLASCQGEAHTRDVYTGHTRNLSGDCWIVPSIGVMSQPVVNSTTISWLILLKFYKSYPHFIHSVIRECLVWCEKRCVRWLFTCLSCTYNLAKYKYSTWGLFVGSNNVPHSSVSRDIRQGVQIGKF